MVAVCRGAIPGTAGRSAPSNATPLSTGKKEGKEGRREERREKEKKGKKMSLPWLNLV